MVETVSAQVKTQVLKWLAEAQGAPRSQIEELSELTHTPEGLTFLVDFIDGVVRTEDPGVAARLLRKLVQDVPDQVRESLPLGLRSALTLAGKSAPLAPAAVMGVVKRALRQLLSDLLVNSNEPALGRFLRRSAAAGQRLNLNLLGEAILGQQEASRRLAGTMALLAREDVDYVSLKVSSVVAPHNPWDFEDAVDHIVTALLPLYRIATGAAATGTTKFINLDMEEYRDLDLTLEVFTRLLQRPEFFGLEAGIVLQAYLPEALEAREKLQHWADARVAAGGAPVKVRLVKGANLPMEKVQAELHGWPQAPLHTKIATDANYLRVLDYSLDPQRLESVGIGIAGHNLFHIALAHQWLQTRGLSRQNVDFEALLGMGQAEMAAVARTVGPLRLYTPVVAPENFDAAIAYLVRRLEESANPDNFMTAMGELLTDERVFEREYEKFVAGYNLFLEQREQRPVPNRTQDRVEDRGKTTTLGEFNNEPDTDPALAQNRLWAEEIANQIRVLKELGYYSTLKPYRVDNHRRLNEVLAAAKDAAQNWQRKPLSERAALIHGVGDRLAEQRSRLAALMGAEAGKTLDQSDPEISEAIDFAYYYAAQALKLGQHAPVVPVPRDVTVVTPPWNFPAAIPTGSTLAALAAGSTVILKPAPQTEHVAEMLAQTCWDAGIPKEVLQLVTVDENDMGRALLSDPRVDQIILTGGIETAELFREFNPQAKLFAETSGKNALIITDSADYDEAVKDLLASAFGHAGQKCSAASLVILTGTAASSTRLRDKIIDAISSLKIGYPEELDTQMGPLVEPPGEKLLTGLTELAPGEQWILTPRQLDDDGLLWSPGLRSGVQPGSAFHQTEYFGPVLGVMQAPNLQRAVAWANQVEFGLTAGLHSLDHAEIRYFQENIQAGNVYINRGITGAIVQRQPFGGWKQSSVGPGAKAGGPNYLLGLTSWRDDYTLNTVVPQRAVSDDWDALFAVANQSGPGVTWLQDCSVLDQVAHESYFAPQDPTGMTAEANVLRYFCTPVTVRYNDPGEHRQRPGVIHRNDLLRTLMAGLTAQRRGRRAGTFGPLLQLSVGQDDAALQQLCQRYGIVYTVATEAEFSAAVTRDPRGEQRVRPIGVLEQIAYPVGCAVYDEPPVTDPIIEGQPYLVEQAVSITTHRYGSERLGLRKTLD